MKIPVVLNNEQIVLDADPDTRLNVILRENSVFSAKKGCSRGFCGACTVLVNDKAVPSCIIPVAAVRNCNIVTLEYFCNTNDYKDIREAFDHENLEFCGYCNAGKIFGTYEIITKYDRPTREDVALYVSHFHCSCTENERLIKGILLASRIRRKRLSGEHHGKR